MHDTWVNVMIRKLLVPLLAILVIFIIITGKKSEQVAADNTGLGVEVAPSKATNNLIESSVDDCLSLAIAAYKAERVKDGLDDSVSVDILGELEGGCSAEDPPVQATEKTELVNSSSHQISPADEVWARREQLAIAAELMLPKTSSCLAVRDIIRDDLKFLDDRRKLYDKYRESGRDAPELGYKAQLSLLNQLTQKFDSAARSIGCQAWLDARAKMK